MKRKLKIAALILGSLFLILVLLLAWVIYTEPGLRFAVARLPAKIGKSMTLKIEAVRGTIAGGFSAERVIVDHELTRTLVIKGSARVNFWPLLVGRISVREAHAEHVEITVKRRVKPRPKTPAKFLPRFLSISAEHATANTMLVIVPNGREVPFTDVSGSGIVGHKTIRIFDGSIIYGFLRSRALGELRAGDPMQLSGEATTRMIIEGQPEWRADATFSGSFELCPTKPDRVLPVGFFFEMFQGGKQIAKIHGWRTPRENAGEAGVDFRFPRVSNGAKAVTEIGGVRR